MSSTSETGPHEHDGKLATFSDAPLMAKPKAAHLWDRADLEWYPEPERCTTQLCAAEPFIGPIHDPACGGGNIVRALLAQGYDATGSDLVNRVGPNTRWWRGAQDFLKFQGRLQNCVVNPPYGGGKLCEAFIRHAIAVTDRKVCVFVNRRFGTGRRRALGLYSEHPPHRIYEITPRPSCPPGEALKAGTVKASGGTQDYAWVCWDCDQPYVQTTLRWLT